MTEMANILFLTLLRREYASMCCARELVCRRGEEQEVTLFLSYNSLSNIKAPLANITTTGKTLKEGIKGLRGAAGKASNAANLNTRLSCKTLKEIR